MVETELHEGDEVAWKPNSAPQSAFCASTEDEVFYGGAKGGAKSDAVVAKPLRQVHLERFKALILRQTFPEAQELIDRSHRIYPAVGNPVWNGSLHRWRFPNPDSVTGAGGGIIQFGHCKSVEEVKQFHGGEWANIYFDELADLADGNVWTQLLPEVRCPNPEVKRQAGGTGNPGRPGHGWCKRRWLVPCGKQGRKIFKYELDIFNIGRVQRTRRFIPAKVTDNPVYANDPVYMANLWSLPKVLRQQLLFGDWDVGFGMALDELDEIMHFVPAFTPPSHWRQFGAFDWGYQHPWVFGHYCISEDGVIYKMNTIRGRHMSDRRIAERINERVNVDDLSYIVAGHDCWAVHKARRDDATESTAERFGKHGIHLTMANIARHAGLKNFREQVAWQEIGPPTEDGPREDGEPNFFWMDTDGNHVAFENVQVITVDPDDAEDALEIDADATSGEGGDDDYDENRYALASRPARSKPTWTEADVRAWSRAVLAAEVEKGRRHLSAPLNRAVREKVNTGGW